MSSRIAQQNRASRLVLTVAALGLTIVALGVVTAPARGAQPDLTVSADQFPGADAVFPRWEQHWTVDADGTVHRREHYWVKLFNARPIDHHGDPRISYENGTDQLVFRTARSILPDGTMLDVPDYSFNVVGPDDVAGWPAYTSWQQMVVSFSGVQPNVVLEMDFEIITPPGTTPWIDGDIDLQDDYPIVERVVTVTIPEGAALHHQVDGMAPGAYRFDQKADGGAVRYEWWFADLPIEHNEPQALPAYLRGGRLRFSTCQDLGTWALTMLHQVDRAGRPAKSVQVFAESATEDEADPVQRVKGVAKKLHDSFNFVESWKATRTMRSRSAENVLQANYGNPLESAAVLLASLRSLGMTATPMVAVDSQRWDATIGMIPTYSAFADVVVAVEFPSETVYVHPNHGVFHNPGSWGHHWLLGADVQGGIKQTYIAARGEDQPSEIQIAGKIAIDKDGQAGGDLRIRATGAFFDPVVVETSNAQKSLIEDFVGRVVTGMDVPGHSVTTLSTSEFRATASVSSGGELAKHGNVQTLRLGDGPVFLPDIALPLDRSYRHTDVKLAGRFKETVDLAIELPEGFVPTILPTGIEMIGGPWGAVSQTVDVEDHTIRIRRTVAVVTELLTPEQFETVRKAVNNLRTAQARVIGFAASQVDN